MPRQTADGEEMTEETYAQSGYTGEGEPMVAYIHPGECIIAKRGDQYVCIREHEHGDDE
jgi:hypothetical protein